MINKSVKNNLFTLLIPALMLVSAVTSCAAPAAPAETVPSAYGTFGAYLNGNFITYNPEDVDTLN